MHVVCWTISLDTSGVEINEITIQKGISVKESRKQCRRED
jgi:hypothetical protein